MRRWTAPIVLALVLAAIPVHAQEGPFVMPPPEADAQRFAYTADAQREGERAGLRDMVDRFTAANVSRLLYGGDTSYGWGDAPDDWLDALGPYAEPDRMLFVYGNHDHGPGYAPYQPSEEGASWWITDVNGTVILGLNTNRPIEDDGPQMAWFEAQLEAHRDDVVIVMMHMPWWLPNAHHDPDTSFRGNASRMHDLVAAHGVDLVLGAHEHYYARHTLDGVAHVVTGPVDATIRSVPDEVAASAERAASVATGVLLDASPCGIIAHVLDGDGDLFDAFNTSVVPAGSEAVVPLSETRVCVAGNPVPQPAEPTDLSFAGDGDDEVDEGPDAASPPGDRGLPWSPGSAVVALGAAGFLLAAGRNVWRALCTRTLRPR